MMYSVLLLLAAIIAAAEDRVTFFVPTAVNMGKKGSKALTLPFSINVENPAPCTPEVQLKRSIERSIECVPSNLKGGGNLFCVKWKSKDHVVITEVTQEEYKLDVDKCEAHVVPPQDDSERIRRLIEEKQGSAPQGYRLIGDRQYQFTFPLGDVYHKHGVELAKGETVSLPVTWHYVCKKVTVDGSLKDCDRAINQRLAGGGSVPAAVFFELKGMTAHLPLQRLQTFAVETGMVTTGKSSLSTVLILVPDKKVELVEQSCDGESAAMCAVFQPKGKEQTLMRLELGKEAMAAAAKEESDGSATAVRRPSVRRQQSTKGRFFKSRL